MSVGPANAEIQKRYFQIQFKLGILEGYSSQETFGPGAAVRNSTYIIPIYTYLTIYIYSLRVIIHKRQ